MDGWGPIHSPGGEVHMIMPPNSNLTIFATCERNVIDCFIHPTYDIEWLLLIKPFASVLNFYICNFFLYLHMITQ